MNDPETGEYVGEIKPTCMFCGKPAACYGEYNGKEGYACDYCCGHSNENGWCDLIEDEDEEIP